MTVNAEVSSKRITPNGVTSEIDCPGLMAVKESDIIVRQFKEDGSTVGVPAFEVEGLGDPAGITVKATQPFTADPTGAVVVERDSEALQQVEIEDFEAKPGEVQEGALDLLTLITQEVRREIRRALRRHPMEADGDFYMPSPSQRRGKALLFANTALAEPVVGTPMAPGTLIVSPFFETLTSIATANDLRNTLGLGTPINVKWHGAAGAGADYSGALNAVSAMVQAQGGGAIYVPKGVYLAKNWRIFSDTWVILEAGAVIKNADAVDLTSVNTIVQLDGDGIRWSGGKIEGTLHGGFGVPPAPYYCMQVFQSTGGTRPKGIVIEDLEVTRGRNGIWVYGAENVALRNIVSTDQYEWGVAIPATNSAGGPNTVRLTVDGLIVQNVGLFEGLKIAGLYQFAGAPHADMHFRGLTIANCGRLDPNPANWQEAFDLFVSAGDRIEISDFILVGCGNGGIEIKRNDAPSINPNHLKNFNVWGGYISVDHALDATVGIALNYTTPNSATPDTARQISIRGVQFEYLGPALPAQAIGISVVAYADVSVSDCDFYGNWTHCVNVSSAGASSDATARRLSIKHTNAQGAQTGLAMMSGAISNFNLLGNVWRTTNDTIVAGSTTGAGLLIDGGHYEVLAGNARFPINLTSNITDVLVRGATLKSDATCFIATTGGGRVERCRLVSSVVAGGACNIGGGTWDLFKNDASAIPDNSALYVTSGGTIRAWGNTRRVHTSAPGLAAQVGEIVPNGNPTAGGLWQWIATASGLPGSATWKGCPVNA